MNQQIYFHLLLSIVISYIIARMILPSILRLITEAGYVRPNFRGDQIPVGVGLVFFLSAILPTGLLIFVNRDIYQIGGLLYLFVLGSMTLLGMTDDIFGSRADSGLRGHLKKMLRGELTTGGLKLVVGGIMSLVVAINISNHWQEIIVNTLVVALSVNAINLLDLRPGRAGKGFLLAGVILGLISWSSSHLVWCVITAGALLAYLPSDLKARAMMGDTGSNALGATIGITSVLVLPENLKMGYLILLIAFHIFTEKYSLTKIIEKNKMLNYLDQLGRNQ
ncbi:glycosyl transferase [Desulfotomaculum defluvii]